jgi:H+-translocating NAD(P) transhydrogenase subunit alpha
MAGPSVIRALRRQPFPLPDLNGAHSTLRILLMTIILAALAEHAPGPGAFDTLRVVVPLIFVFVLATVIGMEVIRNVSRLLHTPLMSLTNAISAVVIVGAILVAGPQLSEDHPLWITVLGLIAITAASINIVSGFLITNRMLKMFKSKQGEKKS